MSMYYDEAATLTDEEMEKIRRLVKGALSDTPSLHELAEAIKDLADAIREQTHVILEETKDL